MSLLRLFYIYILYMFQIYFNYYIPYDYNIDRKYGNYIVSMRLPQYYKIFSNRFQGISNSYNFIVNIFKMYLEKQLQN